MKLHESWAVRSAVAAGTLACVIACRGEPPQGSDRDRSPAPPVTRNLAGDGFPAYENPTPLTGAAIDLSDAELVALVAEVRRSKFGEDAAADRVEVCFNGVERAVESRDARFRFVQANELREVTLFWMIDFLRCDKDRVDIELHSSASGDYGSDVQNSLSRSYGQLTNALLLAWSGWYACIRIPKPAGWEIQEAGM